MISKRATIGLSQNFLTNRKGDRGIILSKIEPLHKIEELVGANHSSISLAILGSYRESKDLIKYL